MKTTIRAELIAIGDVETHNYDGEPVTHSRAILLVGATDDDVRAFAPLMCQGMVTLRVERLEGEAAKAEG